MAERPREHRPVTLDEAFAGGAPAYRATGSTLEGVYVDAGENGLFSTGEFEALTALGASRKGEVALSVTRTEAGADVAAVNAEVVDS